MPGFDLASDDDAISSVWDSLSLPGAPPAAADVRAAANAGKIPKPCGIAAAQCVAANAPPNDDRLNTRLALGVASAVCEAMNDGWALWLAGQLWQARIAGHSVGNPLRTTLTKFAMLPLPAPAVHRNPDRGILMHPTQTGRLVGIPDPSPEWESPSLFATPDDGRMAASYLVQWFRSSKMPTARRRGVAPPEMQILLEAVTSLPRSCRDGRFHSMTMRIRDRDAAPGELTFQSRVFPHGWHPSNMKRDWPGIQKRLLSLSSLAALPIPDPENPGNPLLVPCVYVTVSEKPEGGRIVIYRRIAPEAAEGASIVMKTSRLLRYHGLHWRLFLALTAWIDRFAKRGRLTRLIPAPLLGENGKPLRCKGGRIKREKTPTKPNPIAEDFDLWVSVDDLALAAGALPIARRKGGEHWRGIRNRTLKALLELADEAWCSTAGIPPQFEVELGTGARSGFVRVWQRPEAKDNDA